MRTPKKYTNLHVPWHTHFYRAGLSFFVASEKPWHTHCYRAFQSLAGNRRYAPVEKTNVSLPLPLPLQEGEISWDAFEKDILGQARNYKGIFVLNATVHWNVPLYQRPQHICKALGSLGYLIIYKLANYANKETGFREVSKNVWETNHAKVETIENAVHSIWSTSQWETVETIKRKRKFGKVVYEYVDHMDPVLAGNPENMLRIFSVKNLMFNGGADAIVATATQLYDEVNEDAECGIISLIPNGVETEHYRDMKRDGEVTLLRKFTDFRERYKVVVGYFGAIAPWLWHSEIEKFADMRPDIGFVFIGPAFRGGGEMLPKRENILALGPIPYKDLPCYARLFDICFIPFEPGEVARATSPLKLFEYFALEKPVIVTSDLLECVQYKEVFHGNSAQEFSDALDKALLVKDSPRIKKRYARLADQNSWIVRARQFAKVIDRLNTNAQST